LALGLTAAASWAAAGAGAFSAAGCPDFGVFLAGPTERFLRTKEERHAGQALRCGSRLGLWKPFKRGNCLAHFCPPIANLKNASFEGREKKKENEEKSGKLKS
jgi:hypothetical protein